MGAPASSAWAGAPTTALPQMPAVNGGAALQPTARRHSFLESRGTIAFHAQMLSDFLTVEACGRMMLEELERIA
jgi:hypothetical protein